MINNNTEALWCADELQSTVQTYPDISEDEPGGYYCSEQEMLKDAAAAHIRRLVVENEALRADAERFQWLAKNVHAWTWHPSRAYPGKIVGFSFGSTGYLDLEFQDAIDAARGKV